MIMIYYKNIEFICLGGVNFTKGRDRGVGKIGRSISTSMATSIVIDMIGMIDIEGTILRNIGGRIRRGIRRSIIG